MARHPGKARHRQRLAESAVPEMDVQRVRVVLEPVEEPRLSTEQQRDLWSAWIERGPQGPIEDGPDADIP